ncbi:MAG: AAC(3) family N-acetyltransferase [Bacteroidota bacterium]
MNSSLSSIGIVMGGAETIVEALKEYITKEGLIVMPSYPHRGMYDYLEDYTMFDINNTPSKNGIITEKFRLSEDVYRSLHPTHPLCFWGSDAYELSLGHEKSKSPYDGNSPYKKLLNMDVKNFCIGVDFEHMIMIRVIDDLYENYPAPMYFDNKTYKVPVLDTKDNKVIVETRCHDPKKSRVRHNMNLYPYMKQDIIEFNLGNARTITLSSKKMFAHQVDLSKKGVFPYYDTSFIK